MPAIPLQRTEASDRASHLRNVRYEVELELSDDPTVECFGVTTTVRFDARVGSSTFVELLADKVEEALLNGRRLDVSTIDSERLQLDDLAASNVLVVKGASVPYERTGVGLHRARDPADGATYVYTHFEPHDAHRVFACFDQPDIKGTFSLVVTAPTDWVVVSTGRAVRSAAGAGLTRTTFSTTPPISTYLAAVVAGPYHEVRNTSGPIDLGLFCRKSLAPYLEAEELFTVTQQLFDFYHKAFGIQYPFGDKYDQLFVPEFNMGAMENPACVTFNEAYLFRGRVTDVAREQRATVIAHEMAHMWFGDLVTMRWWDDLWLNESFATFMASHALVQATRFSHAWVTFNAGRKQTGRYADLLSTRHPIAADVPDTHAARQNFDAITYSKGASVLRELFSWVGEGQFFGGVTNYFRRHEWSNTSLRDFLEQLESTSGRDLVAWSREWLETSGANTLRPIVKRRAGRIVSLVVEQTADDVPPTLRAHRLGIGCYTWQDDHLERTSLVEIDVEGRETNVPDLVGHSYDLLVLNDGDLTYARTTFDSRSLRSALASAGRITDPLTRQLVWSALFDRVRGAEGSARSFVAAAARQIPAERDADAAQRVYAAALQAVAYGDPANRLRLRRTLATVARRLLGGAKEGSDEQLVHLRALIAVADTQTDLRRLKRLLEGGETLAGLPLHRDRPLRWSLVTRLAAAGAASEKLIAAELERDETDHGRRGALTARTAIGTAEAKAKAWDLLMGADESISLQDLKAIAAGFDQPGQEVALTPYIGRYAEAVPHWWAERSLEEATALTVGLFPSFRGQNEVRLMAETIAARSDLPPSARRLLREARDAVRMLAAAQQVDAAAARQRAPQTGH